MHKLTGLVIRHVSAAHVHDVICRVGSSIGWGVQTAQFVIWMQQSCDGLDMAGVGK